jgi:multidrug efflux pump subunit AcrB
LAEAPRSSDPERDPEGADGASADVVERTITLPIEEQVNGTDGMLYMSSVSANDGQASLTVTFQLGRDPDIAAVNVNNRVAVAEPRLPEEVRRFGDAGAAAV